MTIFGNPIWTSHPVMRQSRLVNPCPDCGNANWLIGRMTAECAHCSAAVPLSLGGMAGPGQPSHAPLAA